MNVRVAIHNTSPRRKEGILSGLIGCAPWGQNSAENPTAKVVKPSIAQLLNSRCGLIAILLLFVNATSLFAHDGGFGHSRRLMYISPAPDSLVVEYRLKQGLEEALVELVHVDADRDGKVSDAERIAFFTKRGKDLLAKLAFRDGRSGKAISAELEGFELGHSLVQVYRIRVASAAVSVLLEDRNFPHKPGQVAIEVAAGLKAEWPDEIDLSHADQVRVTLRRVPAAKP